MAKISVLLLCLLVVQVSGGIEPSIRIEMTSHPDTQFAFHSLHIPKFTKLSDQPAHLMKLDPTQLCVMFSHLLGLNPSENLFWGGVTSSNPLFRPRALVLLTVDGLSEERTVTLPEGTTSYMVQKDIGVKEWISDTFNPSLLRTRIMEVFGGHNEPLMVSVAGEERVASAGPKGIKMIKEYYNPQTGGVSVIRDYQHTELSKQEAVNLMGTMDIDSISKDTNTISVRRTDGNEVLFNLNYKADTKFFTEILAAMDTIERMRNRRETADNIPDLIAITFTGLKDLRLKYGDSSPQVSAAIQLYSSLLPKLTDQIVSLYSGQVAVFGLTLIWTNPTGVTISQSVNEVYNIAREHLEDKELDHFQLNFPEVILNDESKSSSDKLDSLCSLATEINPRMQLMRVTCPHRIRRDTFLQANNNTNNTINENSLATEKSEEFPYMFNIILLVALIFIITLFAISWSMWHMDPGVDSIIYRTTEPVKLKLD
ncbi:Renin receptor-like [Oopsacas minuta]|uniref:Renin receptor-like n=1 Tax=Oopsacas minuta TaxID=111878 RepID=A0AAV7K848_9METZ|nr:Renin receptor-like [Oopsacas minuta]